MDLPSKEGKSNDGTWIASHVLMWGMGFGFQTFPILHLSLSLSLSFSSFFFLFVGVFTFSHFFHHSAINANLSFYSSLLLILLFLYFFLSLSLLGFPPLQPKLPFLSIPFHSSFLRSLSLSLLHIHKPPPTLFTHFFPILSPSLKAFLITIKLN